MEIGSPLRPYYNTPPVGVRYKTPQLFQAAQASKYHAVSLRSPGSKPGPLQSLFSGSHTLREPPEMDDMQQLDNMLEVQYRFGRGF